MGSANITHDHIALFRPWNELDWSAHRSVKFTWASGDTLVAVVDGKGLVTGISAGLVTAAGNGTATITATAGSASGETTVTGRIGSTTPTG